MSRSIRVALALLIVGLGLGIVLHMSPSRAGSTSAPAPARAVSGVAITVADMDRSIDFYATVVGGGSENHGPEQEQLNNVPGARLRITTLRAAEGPAIELLEYLAPRDGRPFPPNTRANDLVRWHTLLFTSPEAAAKTLGVRRGSALLDPDGHALELRAK